MTQAELNREVASATGENVTTVAQMGFVPLTAIPYERDREPLVLDWDEWEELLENASGWDPSEGGTSQELSSEINDADEEFLKQHGIRY